MSPVSRKQLADALDMFRKHESMVSQHRFTQLADSTDTITTVVGSRRDSFNLTAAQRWALFREWQDALLTSIRNHEWEMRKMNLAFESYQPKEPQA